MVNDILKQSNKQVVFEENRFIIVVFGFFQAVLLFLTGSLFFSIKQVGQSLPLYSIKDYLVLYIPLTLMFFAMLLSIWSIIYLLCKFIFPSKLTLTQLGIVGSGINQLVSWNDIEKIEYFKTNKIKNTTKDVLKFISIFVTLFFVSSPFALLKLAQAKLCLDTFESSIITMKLNKGKVMFLRIDESLVKDLPLLFKDEVGNGKGIIPYISAYKRMYYGQR